MALPDSRFTLKPEQGPDVLTLHVAGAIDSVNTREFHASLKDTIRDSGRSAVVLHLADLAYISSAGLRSVLLVAEDLHRNGTRLALCSLPDSIMKIIQATGFDSIIDVYVSHASAVAAVTR